MYTTQDGLVNRQARIDIANGQAVVLKKYQYKIMKSQNFYDEL